MLVVITERLYYTDCYLTTFEATVTGTTDQGYRIYLDQTAFYPTSGGQPHDIGSLDGEPVCDVIDEENQIAHVTASPVRGGRVQGKVDWNRRYDHMQQHTGQHLLSASLLKLFGFRTVSFHMGEEVSTIELETKELSDTQIDEAEEFANRIVREARPVSIQFAEAEETQGLRKPSQRSGILRVIEIEDLDRSACGGTHVRSTAELGPIQIRRLERIRGNVRMEFVCGIRALRRAKQDFRIAFELAKQSAVGIDALPQHVAGLRLRLTQAEKERQSLALEIAKRDGELLYQETAPSEDRLRRAFLQVAAIDDVIRAKAQAFTCLGRALALAIGSEPPGALIACSEDSGINAGIVLRQALSPFGGRGGGSATLAQGNLPNQDAVESLKAALGVKS